MTLDDPALSLYICQTGFTSALLQKGSYPNCCPEQYTLKYIKLHMVGVDEL